ncbi:MAG TPA: hypothetical protein DD640_02710 [Clostridiales bacterium]|nr:hypothetical protein [Clostridiales bacterium]
MAKSIALALLQQGQGRRHNENNLYFLDSSVPFDQRMEYERSAASSEALQFYAVADGVGGGVGGGVAAQAVLLALDRQARRYRPGSPFDFPAFARDLIGSANQTIGEQLGSDQSLPAGTTLSLLVIDRDRAYTLSLGDSRIYLLRENQLCRLTEDRANRLPERRRMGAWPGTAGGRDMPEPDNLTDTALLPGDILLLTTVGVTGQLTDSLITAGLNRPGAFIQQIRHLREMTLNRGDQDDFALIGIKILEPLPAPARPEPGQNPRQALFRSGRRPGRPDPGQPAIKGSGGLFPDKRYLRLLRPLLFFLAFVLLGIILGKLLFELPAWLNRLFP